ncbi:MAG: NAD+ synthase [Micavibrio aeruginosavorus]|uniref:Glutamine-dependent NAD(+) synthetase n=1 Tax=Micavibrio aeruginosavorus TaxID=349221 RepID=A0A2W5FFN3_9BACT|nr:MAG: NAD+ synthase [Micavibrio aeruginosavorus]
MDKPFIITIAQINPKVGDLKGNLDLIRRVRDEAPKHANLIVFPELVITGYPPEDLLLKQSFLDGVDSIIDTLVEESRGRATAMLITAPSWNRENKCLYNAVHLIHQGHILATQTKHDLPNYGIFDEHRYFKSGPLPEPMSFMGLKLGVMICEDMWYPEVADNLKAKGADILIVSNASPYEGHKHDIRYQHARLRATKTGLPLIYVNQFGGQDELVFDGASFMMNETGQVILQCEEFVEEFQDLTLVERRANGSWLIATEDMHPVHSETESMYQAVMLATRDYIHKSGMKDVLIGMSGGIDSALVAAIATDALGSAHVKCVMMPSPYTSEDSIADATDCARKLGVHFETVSIEPMMNALKASMPDLSGLAHENMQSRIRGTILMSMSNQSGAIVLTTGNKSEIAAGYSTLYGDMCGGFNPLKDLYKTQVYNLATWRNSAKPVNALGPEGEIINERILTKAPSAELRPDQKDQDSLPPYDVLDEILMGIIEDDLGIDDLVARGHEPAMVGRVNQLLDRAEYKRRQSAPGPKISPRAFGRDRRYPIVNGYVEKS